MCTAGYCVHFGFKGNKPWMFRLQFSSCCMKKLQDVSLNPKDLAAPTMSFAERRPTSLDLDAEFGGTMAFRCRTMSSCSQANISQ